MYPQLFNTKSCETNVFFHCREASFAKEYLKNVSTSGCGAQQQNCSLVALLMECLFGSLSENRHFRCGVLYIEK